MGNNLGNPLLDGDITFTIDFTSAKIIDPFYLSHTFGQTSVFTKTTDNHKVVWFVSDEKYIRELIKLVNQSKKI